MAEQDQESGFAALDAKLDADLDAIPDDAGPAADVAAPDSPATEAQPPAEAVPTAAQTAAPPAVDPSPGQTPVLSKARAEWLAKYNGDADAADAAVWETNNRASQMSARIKELEAKIAEGTAAPPAAPKAPEHAPVPANVQRYETDKAEAESAWKAAGETLQRYNSEKAEIQRELDQITSSLFYGQLELDKEEAARNRGRQLRSALSEYDRAISSVEADRRQSLRDYRDAKDKLEIAGQYAEMQAARQAEITKQSNASLERFGSQFFGHMGAASKEIPEDLREDFRKEVKREALLQLTAPGMDLDAQDVAGFVTKVKTEFLARHARHEKAAQTKYSVGKTADMEVKAPEGKKAVAPEVKSSRFANREELEAHIEAGLGL